MNGACTCALLNLSSIHHLQLINGQVTEWFPSSTSEQNAKTRSGPFDVCGARERRGMSNAPEM